MAYEEKTNYDDDTSLYSFLRLVNILMKKWWVVVIFMVAFALLGFIFSRITYTEQYSSQIIFNVSNKDKDIAGTAATYVTQSDAQASGMIAINFKELVENGNDFITMIQENVEAKTGKKYDKKYLRRLMSVSLVTDGTLVYITVTSDDKELSNAVSNAIKDSYEELTTSAFPTANFTIADNPTPSELQTDTSAFIYLNEINKNFETKMVEETSPKQFLPIFIGEEDDAFINKHVKELLVKLNVAVINRQMNDIMIIDKNVGVIDDEETLDEVDKRITEGQPFILKDKNEFNEILTFPEFFKINPKEILFTSKECTTVIDGQKSLVNYAGIALKTKDFIIYLFYKFFNYNNN